MWYFQQNLVFIENVILFSATATFFNSHQSSHFLVIIQQGPGLFVVCFGWNAKKKILYCW